MQKKKFYITTPIYYVNAPPHIGHLYTTVAADVLARFLRQSKKDVFFLTGTDEHGSKIEKACRDHNIAPKEYCDLISSKFKKSWKEFNIEYDRFIRTTDSDHIKTVEEFVLKIYNKGDVYEGKYQGLYCVSCEDFVLEKDLVGGKCKVHKIKPAQLREINWFFKLEKYLPTVKKLIEQNKIQVAPIERKNEVLGLFKQGLLDFSISRPKSKVSWGIEVPWDKSQIIYVWVDALINYYTAAKTKRLKDLDLHIIGKDILKFHCIFWPALLLSAGIKPPHKIFVHGYFTINGEKMSKTLGNIIEPSELIKKFSPDASRYLLLSLFPFGQDGDISIKKLTEKYNSDLANGLGNLVSRTAKLAQGLNNATQDRFRSDKIKNDIISESMQQLDFYRALKLILKKIESLNKYINDKEPWKLDLKERKVVLEKTVNQIIEIAQDLAPFMPQTSQKVIALFQKSKIKAAKPLFPRL